MYDYTTTIGNVGKIFCNICQRETNHELVYLHKKEFDKVNFGRLPMSLALGNHDKHRFFEVHSVWHCRGCEAITYKTYDAWTNQRTGETIESGQAFYPNRIAVVPRNFNKLNYKLESLYIQIVENYNQKSFLLCSIGLRTLLEGVCVDKGIKGQNLANSIQKLGENQLPSHIAEKLHAFRFIGNKAAHELVAPPSNELCLAIEVVGDLLNFMYEIDEKLNDLSKNNKK